MPLYNITKGRMIPEPSRKKSELLTTVTMILRIDEFTYGDCPKVLKGSPPVLSVEGEGKAGSIGVCDERRLAW
jgi:hypothetical protein